MLPFKLTRHKIIKNKTNALSLLYGFATRNLTQAHDGGNRTAFSKEFTRLKTTSNSPRILNGSFVNPFDIMKRKQSSIPYKEKNSSRFAVFFTHVCTGDSFGMVKRRRSSMPINTAMLFVPQQEAWIVERMGRFHCVMDPGFNILIPFVDQIKYVKSLKENAIDVPRQSAITSDNVTLNIDGVLYFKVVNPYLASYGVEDPEYAVTQLAQTTMRSELGKISLDNVFRERESLNVSIVESINKASAAWGISCLRYEIRDIKLPSRIHKAMQMQVEAERKKRAAILESEGIREADINVAEGKRQSKILQSEAIRQEQINLATGEAEATLTKAKARALGLMKVAEALESPEGREAAALSVAEQYVNAFQNMAKTNNTMILPNNTGDISGSVAQAMTIYKLLNTALETGKTLNLNQALTNEPPPPSRTIHLPTVGKTLTA